MQPSDSSSPGGEAENSHDSLQVVNNGPGNDGVDETSFREIGGSVNHAPVIQSLPVTQLDSNEPYFYPIEATDADGDRLTWTLARAPTGLKIDPQSGLLYGTGIKPGSHAVSIRVEDQDRAVADQDYTLVVEDNPVISSIPPAFTYAGVPFRYRVTASATDRTDLAFSLRTGSQGMQLDTVTGQLGWQVPVPGQHRVVIDVTSTTGAVSEQDFTLTVLEEDSVRIITVPDDIAYVDYPYTYRVSAVSLTGGVDYRLLSGHQEMSLDSSGFLTWLPSSTGTVSVAISASVSGGIPDIQKFDINILSPETLDRELTGVLDRVLDYLQSGDVEALRSVLTAGAMKKYLPVLNELQPYMREIISTFGAMERVSINHGSAEYILERGSGESRRLFLVTFLRGSNEQWKLHSL